MKPSRKDCAESGSPLLEADEVFGQFDLINHIFSFLDCKELLFFAVASKKHTESLTYERVVHSVFEMRKGESPESWKRLLPLVERQQIWTPSPLRMLSLALRKTCERCNATTADLSKSFGVLYCDTCVDQATSAISTEDVEWTPFISSPRVASSCGGGEFLVWERTIREAGGHCLGPVANKEQMKDLMNKRLPPGVTHEGALVAHLDQLTSGDPFGPRSNNPIATFRAFAKAIKAQEFLKRLSVRVCVTVIKNGGEGAVQKLFSNSKGTWLCTLEMVDSGKEATVELDEITLVQPQAQDRVQVVEGSSSGKLGVLLGGTETVVVRDSRDDSCFMVPMANLVKLKA